MKLKSKHVLLGGLVIWIMGAAPVVAQQANTLTRQEKKDGWALLFDGASTSGWTTPGGKPVPAGWVAENGTLTAKKSAKGGDIITIGEYADFDLKLDYNIEATGNSGVKYFYTKYETGGNLGMEYQILDDKLAEDNKKENHLTGSFYDAIPPDATRKKVNKPGQWNTVRIVAKGRQVEHWLNGIKILEFTRGSALFTEAVALSKFNKTVPAFGTVEKGRILLQEHGSEISFRNIKIKAL
ncbi:3-keto-disaccharide hydrolase [Spirosoma utsteinense]|uniref:3-keto-alpha-glucoside-1,2-lyase/3-keto-2-hydroxy-glucal hydratase domain-containing protein n=1 Tax=Spirosoma utsteinense TaxID=2585773 RepID=A0ABR6WEE1_9BACT|nr:DUF1080 domain-containing protein [Spirosoma utsteinense]MBC3788814.1 hypothetical protein [Spirosoma utsteinense]MBC3794858.1 hypothetical protein [Spirosoma utsteinense]